MNFKISGTIRVHVIGSGFVSLESSLGIDWAGCCSCCTVYCVQHVVGLSEVAVAIKMSHDQALASLDRAVRVE